LTLRAGAVVRRLTLPVTPTSINDVVLAPEVSGIRTGVGSPNGPLSAP
jgi:hypothetical protein